MHLKGSSRKRNAFRFNANHSLRLAGHPTAQYLQGLCQLTKRDSPANGLDSVSKTCEPPHEYKAPRSGCLNTQAQKGQRANAGRAPEPVLIRRFQCHEISQPSQALSLDPSVHGPSPPPCHARSPEDVQASHRPTKLVPQERPLGPVVQARPLRFGYENDRFRHANQRFKMRHSICVGREPADPH